MKKSKDPSFVVQTTVIIFFCLLFSLSVGAVFSYFAQHFFWQRGTNLFFFGLILVGSSAFITFVAFRIFSSRLIRSERLLHDVLTEIAQGNFDVALPDDVEYFDETMSDLKTVLAELKNVKIMRNDFISDFSHELKTPMITIHGFAELLMGDVSEAERKEYAGIILDESKRLTKLSGNILLLHKVNSQSIVCDKKTFSLDEQLRLCLTQFSREIDEKELQVECQADPVQFVADSDLLQQVWINLLSNAIKFSARGGTLSVELKKTDKAAVVSITDDGCGMNENTKKHAFDQFYQGDPSHSAEGNGLGLSIVQRIVELCHGSVDIESVPEEGTTVRVSLPL